MNKQEYILDVLGLNVSGKELTVEEIGKVFKDFKEVKKVLDSYEKETLKPYFFSSAENFGTQTESGGHKVVLDDGTGWEKQARVSVKVDQEKAINLMNEKGLAEYVDTEELISPENMEDVIKVLKFHNREDLITKEHSVSDSSLEQAYLNQQITDDELGTLVTRKTVYALVEVKAKKK